jgi:hypothetical protein
MTVDPRLTIEDLEFLLEGRDDDPPASAEAIAELEAALAERTREEAWPIDARSSALPRS